MRGLAWTAVIAAALAIAALILGVVGYWETDVYLLGFSGLLGILSLVVATLSLRE